MMHPTAEQLLAFIDGELADAVAGDVSAHLSACEHCTAAVAELRETAEQFRDALAGIDAEEPAEWSVAHQPLLVVPVSVAAPPVSPAATPASPRVRPAGAGEARQVAHFWSQWRRAAAVLLLAAGGASAAWYAGVRLQPAPPASVSEPTQATPSATTAVPVAALVAEPSAGMLELAIENAAATSRLQVSVEDRADVRLEVSGTAAPRFTSMPGRVAAELSGERAELLLRVPPTLGELRVLTGGARVLLLRGGEVVAQDSAAGGLVISTNAERER